MNYFEYETINVEYYKSPLYSYSCSLMSWLVPGLISLFIIESTADFLCLVQLIRDWCCLLISAQNMAEIQLQRRFSLILTSLTELAAPILFAAASTPGSGGHWHETSSSGGKTSPDHSPYAVTASRQWWQEFSILVIIRKQGQGCSHIGCSF